MTIDHRRALLNCLLAVRVSSLLLIGNSCIRVGLFAASHEYGRLLDQITIAALSAGLYVFARITRNLVFDR